MGSWFSALTRPVSGVAFAVVLCVGVAGCSSLSAGAYPLQGCGEAIDVVDGMQAGLSDARGATQLRYAMARGGAASQDLREVALSADPALATVLDGLAQDYARLAQLAKRLDGVESSYPVMGLINSQVGQLASLCGTEAV